MQYRPIWFYDLLPHAGMILPSYHLTSRVQRDQLVRTKLTEANVIGCDTKRHVYHRNLNNALAAMFVAAAKDEVRAKLQVTKTAKEDKDGNGKEDNANDQDDEGGYLDFVDEVKKHAEWANHMSSSLFLDFFTALLGARVAWNATGQTTRTRLGL
ncbi:hypothetical protein PG996_013319 [Apiospora saccharicola]|uniref:Uncharacterized protein n=1 Tax=Apiospora saccharicola TaxID=335842 RepID=A0ABR1U7T3_9PEZI